MDQSTVTKALDPTEDWQFNQKHPRGFGGKFGAKPMQEQVAAEATPPEPEGDPAESESVDSGTNEQDAEVAVAKDHVKNLKKSAEDELPGETPLKPSLVVVFTSRADATKFAIAADQVLGNDAHLAVTAVANGKYHVEPEGLSATEVDALQEMIHAKVPLSEMTLFSPEPTPEPMDEALDTAEVTPEPKKRRKKKQEPKADGASADNLAVTAGLEETAREMLQEAVTSGKVHQGNLGDVLAMAGAIASLTDSHDTGFLPVAEAIHYGSLSGLKRESERDDLETAARARTILDHLGGEVLEKGATMKKPLLLIPIKNKLSNETHDPNENDGKALPLGSHERVTGKVGEKEDVTEETAKYPKTGHKQARRPRLILNR